MDGNDRLEELLGKLLNNPRRARRAEGGVGLPTGQAPRRGGVSPDHEPRGTREAAAEATKERQPPRQHPRPRHARTRDGMQRAHATGILAEFVGQIDRARHGGRARTSTPRSIKAGSRQIDKLLSAQLNEIMHDAEFQKLEAPWRGLHYLVASVRDRRDPEDPGPERLARRTCSRTWRRPVEFDQSALFKKSLRGGVRHARRRAVSACSSATTSSASTRRT